MSEEENRRPTEQRPIRDIKGLLKFCLEATRQEDAPNVTNIEQFGQMTVERRKWLDEALNSLAVNPVERIDLCVKIIEDAEVDTESGTEQQIHAISELQDWVEDVDIAGDLIKINGLRVVPKLLSSEVSEIRWRCLELLGNLSQNNPVAQISLLTLKLLPVMLLMLETDPNPVVRVKAMYAISCLVRNNKEALEQFLAEDGLSIIAKSLCSNDEKLRVKASFMISSICGSNTTLKDTLVDIGTIEKLVHILKEEDHDSTHEHIMSALVTITSDHAAAQKRCLNSDFDMKSFLCQRIRLLQGKEPFQEEKEHAEKLLEILNTNQYGQSSSQGSNQNFSVMTI